ncbi:arsB, partial [Symbiodinium sp. KB8]
LEEVDVLASPGDLSELCRETNDAYDCSLQVTIMLEHIPKTKDELLQEMDVLAASLTAGLDASPGADRAEGDPEAEAPMLLQATIVLERVPKSQDELHAEMNVLAASLTAGLTDLPSKNHVEDDAAEVATLAPEQEEMQEMHALVATEPSPPAEEARDTPRSGASGQSSTESAELDLAKELVHAACQAEDTPQEALSVVVSQASAAVDAAVMVSALKDFYGWRDWGFDLSVPVGQSLAVATISTEGSFPASSLGEEVQAAVPLPIMSEPASEAPGLSSSTRDFSNASVLVEPPRSKELLLDSKVAMMDNLAQSLIDGLQVVDVKQAQPAGSETQPSAKAEAALHRALRRAPLPHVSAECRAKKLRCEDVAEQDRPTSGGFDRSVASVLASAACSEAAEAGEWGRADLSYVFVQQKDVKEEGFPPETPHPGVGSGSEEAGKLGAAAAAKLLLEAQPAGSETQPSAKAEDVAEQDRPTSGGFDRSVASVLASAACSEAAEELACSHRDVVCSAFDVRRLPGFRYKVFAKMGCIGSVTSEQAAKLGAVVAAKLLREAPEAGEVQLASSETQPSAKDVAEQDRPTSGGFDRSVASVLASAACSEAAEAGGLGQGRSELLRQKNDLQQAAARVAACQPCQRYQ